MFNAYACGLFDLSGCNTIMNTINQALLPTFFTIIWIVAIGFGAYGGLLYITSAGDKGKATEAKTALTNALIGIVVVLALNITISMLQSLFGFSGGQTITAPKITAPTIK